MSISLPLTLVCCLLLADLMKANTQLSLDNKELEAKLMASTHRVGELESKLEHEKQLQEMKVAQAVAKAHLETADAVNKAFQKGQEQAFAHVQAMKQLFAS